MATNPDRMNECTLTVLPMARRTGRTCLDAGAALELAVLGATARRTISLGDLVDTVWCLSGGEWRPPREVVFAALQLATRSGTVEAKESWVKSVPFVYTLTRRGAAVFNDLMRLPLPVPGDPVTRAGASVKYGLLELADDKDAIAISADLKRFYLECRNGVEQSRGILTPDRVFLNRMIAERLAWLDFRIDTLDELTTKTRQRKYRKPGETPAGSSPL